ncbi:MAG: cysteine synthase family protein [Treponema sp.]|nr:cysteine synthase family protein [Treponema sp.]
MHFIEAVGNTPLVSLDHINPARGRVSLYAKAELFNPSGSVKDRAAKAMVEDGLKRGALTKEKILIDATSGNTGIAYALLGALYGFKVQLVIPANVNFARKGLMRAYGAEIIESDPLEGSDGAYHKVRDIVAKNPDKYFYPDQYNNPANWKAHYETTAEEIWKQTEGKVTHFVTGGGTTGTFTGTSRRLHELKSDIHTILMQPDGPFHGIEGNKHLETTERPGIFDESLVEKIVPVATETAYKTVHALAHDEGILAGISSGANVAAAIEVAKDAPDGSVVVTILCDAGYRYLDEPVWEGIQ